MDNIFKRRTSLSWFNNMDNAVNRSISSLSSFHDVYEDVTKSFVSGERHINFDGMNEEIKLEIENTKEIQKTIDQLVYELSSNLKQLYDSSGSLVNMIDKIMPKESEDKRSCFENDDFAIDDDNIPF